MGGCGMCAKNAKSKIDKLRFVVGFALRCVEECSRLIRIKVIGGQENTPPSFSHGFGVPVRVGIITQQN